MPPIELAERLALLLALALFLGPAFEEVYKRDEPTIPGGIGPSRCLTVGARSADALTVLALLGFAAAAVYIL
jgi:hypothetical protein